MSAKENPCKKFQANIFNKSKCQNCFKPRESHLLSDEDLNQAKPIYGGWLLLAPEGTDFDNPMHRSRKWQRRFFILYEHGLLRYALDEMPTTLPQGTINMNQCTDVIDGENRTGQKFSLCILTPEEHFIRAENKEIINGWLEMLIVYPKTNKQNQKKKRKVEPPTPQEPGPAKMAVTSSGIPGAEKVPATKSTLWQEEMKSKEDQENHTSPLQSPVQMPSSPTETMVDGKTDGGLVNGDRTDGGRKTRVESGYFSLEKMKDLKTEEQPPQTPPSPSTPDAPSRYSDYNSHSPELDPFSPPGTLSTPQLKQSKDVGEHNGHSPFSIANRQYAILADVPRARRISHRDAFQVERKRLEQQNRARSPGREEVARMFGQQRRKSLVIEKFEALDIEKAEQMETSSSTKPTSEARQGRSEKRTFPRKRDESGVSSISDVSASPMSPYRRAKSLDRRSSESSMTPDLLNFKKGWLTKQCQDGQWKKHWFVLTDQTLRFYRDSVAEEAADLDGEIDLSTCYDVTEYPVQRNYGFQIHTKEGEFTLSAMTSGIRRNWIQTILKHVRPNTAPDVTSSLPEEKSKNSSSFSPPQSEKPESERSEVDVEQKRSRARERRREGRSKTFDWAEFRPIQQAMAQERAEALKSLSCYDTTDSRNDLEELERERARRREERRKRFESSDSVEEQAVEDASRMDVDRGPVLSENMDVRPNVQVEIEQRWQQVETTPLREEKQIPISPLPPSSPPLTHPSEDITTLLQKQLEQSQKEVTDLLEEKLALQQRLKEAFEQQLNARDGYVLQNELAYHTPDACQRLHKVNEDLQNELESQCKRQELLSQQIQAIKHSYGEANDSIRHQDSEILSLQALLNRSYAELMIKEQALEKLKGDLKMEKDKAKELLEEWQVNEATLTTQLMASQQKLKEAESMLLEKSQQLRELEMQQALQRDHQKEMQKLQEKLTNTRSRLDASEQAGILTETRLKMNYKDLLGSSEKEKLFLLHNLKEAEDILQEYEDKLQGNDQLMEILQKEKLSASTETNLLVHHLEKQLSEHVSKIQKLEEHTKELEQDRDRLNSSCQEMTNQIRISDHESASLQERLNMQKAEYDQLRISLEMVSGELLKAKETLRGKEEELRLSSETHRRIVDKKDQDINEAIIKMSALGSSLEETETKLKVKDEALRRFSHFDAVGQVKDFEEMHLQLEAAKKRITELEQSLLVHRGNAVCEMLDRNSFIDDIQEQTDEHSPLYTADTSMVDIVQDSGSKKQRIRFSSIQCQKYVHADGSEKTWASCSSSETSQDPPINDDCFTSEGTASYQPSAKADVDAYLSIIHSLESKLCETEEKLKIITQKVQNEKSCMQAQHTPSAEGHLEEQFPSSSTPVISLEEEQMELQRTRCSLQGVAKEVFSSLESCRTMLKDLLNHKDDAELFYSTLSGIEDALTRSLCSLQQTPVDQVSGECSNMQCMDTNMSNESQHPPCDGSAQLLSEKLDLGAKMMYALAESLKLASPEAVLDNKQSEEACRNVFFMQIWTERLKLESDFRNRLERLRTDIVRNSGELDNEALLKVELSCVAGKMESSLHHMKYLQLELQKTQAALGERSITEGSIPSCVSLDLEQADQHSPKPQGSNKSNYPSISFQEILFRQLREYAVHLSSLSSSLQTKSAADLVEVQMLLDIPQPLICCDGSFGLSGFATDLVQEVVLQAQLLYVAFKSQTECEQEYQKKREALSCTHSEALDRLCLEYQSLLQDKQAELVQRERAASGSIELANRQLKEAETGYNEGISRLDLSYKRDIENVTQKWTESERVLLAEKAEVINKLEASEKERQNLESHYLERLRNLEAKFQEQVDQLQVLHNNEIQALEDRYLQSIRQLEETLDNYQEMPSPQEGNSLAWSEESQGDTVNMETTHVLRERILTLEAEMDLMREQMDQQQLQANVSSVKEKYQADFEKLKATCERGFAAMEETHQKKIEDLHRQHQRELEKLQDEKDRLLAEETAATISAIEAMKNAHREELERELEKSHRSQFSSNNADVESLRRQYLEELQSVQRELEVLSEQYSQKCLENAHLAQALEAERQALRQCQRENQELNAHNQELNNRLASEITRLRTLITGDGGGDVSPLTQGKDAYELEVLLRVKESEIQYQKQEISSLKDELQTALRDKKYASNKYKDIYTELSNMKAKAECDISRLKDQLQAATELLGDKSPENSAVPGYDIMKSKSNPDFLKNDRPSINRQLRNIRSKSVIEQVSWDN
ncbi:protein outspread isoform X2 [Xenopus laevis]|uniref:Protein outspread isoform X2 n=1 Tax=Xenopus laevis TaxID=8355 RepID=A0A8J1M0C3_XENLA|nr:protein outspread isoform X2 [Xenopus laevis]XP_041434757.1 protein outspread isoform X2 [Xenopus laevis]